MGMLHEGGGSMRQLGGSLFNLWQPAIGDYDVVTVAQNTDGIIVRSAFLQCTSIAGANIFVDNGAYGFKRPILQCVWGAANTIAILQNDFFIPPGVRIYFEVPAVAGATVYMTFDIL